MKIEETICPDGKGNPLKYLEVLKWLFEISPKTIILTHADSSRKLLGKTLIDYSKFYDVSLCVNDISRKKLRGYEREGIMTIEGNIFLYDVAKKLETLITYSKLDKRPIVMINNCAKAKNAELALKCFNSLVDYQIVVFSLRKAKRILKRIKEKFRVKEEKHFRQPHGQPMCLLLVSNSKRRGRRIKRPFKFREVSLKEMIILKLKEGKSPSEIAEQLKCRKKYVADVKWMWKREKNEND